MKKPSPLIGGRIFLLLIGMLVLSISAISQNPSTKVFEDWNTPDAIQADYQRAIVRSKVIGGSTYYFVCGSSMNASGNYDIFIQKKNSSGAVLWTQVYNGAGNKNDYGADVQISSTGSVYVCGTYYKNSTDSNNAIIIKYSASGNQQWAYTYNGSGSRHDIFAAMQLSTNAVVAVGTTYKGSTNLYDMLAARVDTNGNQVWLSTWDHVNLNDGAVNLYNSGTKVYIAGGAQSAVTTYKYAVWNVKFSDGSIQGSTVTGGTAFGFDQLTDIQYDANGFIYLTGGVNNTGTGYDIKTVKLDSTLNIIWQASYDSGDSLSDVGTGLTLDQVGNVIVTGYRTSATSGRDYVTIKYSSGGTQRWVSTFDGGINAHDSATCVVVSATDTNKIYVSGYSYNSSSKDYLTLKFDGLGNRKWDIGFNNLSNTDDRATAIALDDQGNILVAGQNKLNDTTYTYTTVKYIEKSTMMPQDTISATSNSFVFTENRGQLFGTDTLQHPELKFYTIHGQPRVYFMDTAVSYVFAKLDSATTNDSLARIDMKFKNANSGLRIRSLDQREEINNFYNPRIPGRKREQVHNYDQLVSFNVWNNVDMVYGSNLRGLKYYFICKPGGGGNPATQIDLLYQGADSVRIDGNGQLILYTKLGNIVQPKASAWQLDANGNFSSLGWQPNYTILGTNEVGFTSFGSFNTAYPLIIAVDWGDIFPTMIQNLDWSTYYGGNAMDQLNDVDVDQTNGSSHYSGWTLSPNFPVTLQPHQPANSGGWDAVAIRCKSDGSRVYATYYGTGIYNSSFSGQWGETGAVDADGNFFIGGRTSYAFLNITFPAQPPGSYMDTTFNGAPQDAFIAAFDTLGELFWATYYGGSGTSSFEGIYDMLFDANGNLYAVMTCDSLTPCFFQAGAYNDTTNRNGMIMKFDQNLALVWATRFGTDSNGTVSRIAKDSFGNLYATGTAEDSLLPIVNPGGGAYVDSTFGGAADAFLARFNSADSLTWSTYFGGDIGGEVGNGIEIISNEIYLYGSSYSPDFPYVYAGAGTYIDSSYNAGKDIYIAEFKANGQLIWSTFIGGSGSDSPGNIDADTLGNIYCTGTTTSSNFPLVNASGIYYDASYAGGTDMILLSFNVLKQMTWSTYFGGTNTEGHNEGLDVYADSCLYICGWTTTPNTATSPFPTQVLMTGFWQGTLNGTQSDGFISRFILTPLIILGTEELGDSSPVGGVLTIYPNPSSGEFQVIIDVPTNNSKIEVYDMMGQLVSSFALPDSEISQTVSLNLSDQATGIYFIVLQDQNGVYSQKVIKQ